MPVISVPFVAQDVAENDRVYTVRLTRGEGNADIGIEHASQIKLDRYVSNPVVLWSHSGFSMPIGLSHSVDYDSTTESLIATFSFSETNPFVTEIKAAWDEGVLRAVSVGVDMEDYLREWSIVAVGNDPEALRIASIGNLIQKSDSLYSTMRGENVNGATRTTGTNIGTDIPGTTTGNGGKPPEESSMGDQNIDLGPLTEQVARLTEGFTGLGDTLTSSFKDALVAHDQTKAEAERQAEARKADEEKRITEAVAAGVKAELEKRGIKEGSGTPPPPAPSGNGGGDGAGTTTPLTEAMSDAQKKMQQDIDKAVVARAKLIAMAGPQLPDNFDPFNASAREILEAALGKDNVNQDDTDDVLLGKLSMVAVSRQGSDRERIAMMAAGTGFGVMEGAGGGGKNTKGDQAYEDHMKWLKGAWQSPDPTKEG